MSDYTAREVEDAVQVYFDETNESWYEFEYDNIAIALRGESVKTVPVARFGGEGMGDERWLVFQVGSQLFRKDGYYSSAYGSDWDGDLYEVTAKEKTVTVYE